MARRPYHDLTKKQFGRLTVIKEAARAFSPSKPKGHIHWLCRCSCGNMTTVRTNHLLHGATVSCGCLRRTLFTTHGMSGMAAYRVWESMLRRCHNPKTKDYKNYGGRGISICTRWHKFENFFKDMGERPPKMTLDRRNNNGNYAPNNCYWATPTQQSRNTRRNHCLTFKGQTKPIGSVVRKISSQLQYYFYY